MHYLREGRGLRRQLPPERRAHAERQDPARVRVSGSRRWAQWLGKNGEIHLRHARRPHPPAGWGVTTRKGKTGLRPRPRLAGCGARHPLARRHTAAGDVLKGGAPARFAVQADGTVLLTLDPKARDDYDTVIAFEMLNGTGYRRPATRIPQPVACSLQPYLSFGSKLRTLRARAAISPARELRP